MSRFSADPDPDPTLRTKKLKFRSRLDGFRGQWLLFTAIVVAAMVAGRYGQPTTRYCESLYPDTVGKPYFDIDETRDDGENPGQVYIDMVLQDVKERITKFFRDELGDSSFEPTQLAIAQRHGVKPGGKFKVCSSFPFVYNRC